MQVARDLKLKQYRMEQATRPTSAQEMVPAPRPSSEPQHTDVPRQNAEMASSRILGGLHQEKGPLSRNTATPDLRENCSLQESVLTGCSGTHEGVGPSTYSLVPRQNSDSTPAPCMNPVLTSSAPPVTMPLAYWAASDLLCPSIPDSPITPEQTMVVPSSMIITPTPSSVPHVSLDTLSRLVSGTDSGVGAAGELASTGTKSRPVPTLALSESVPSEKILPLPTHRAPA